MGHDLREKSDKDLIITAIPEEHKAIVESNSADGMVCLNRIFHTSQSGILPDAGINKFLAAVKEAGLTFSFRKN